MRAYLLGALALVIGCVGDTSPVNTDGGSDVTTTKDTGTTNDSSTTGDGGDGGAWSPSSFGADLALWLVGDKVSETAGAVDTWYDQSTYKTNPISPNPTYRPLHEKGVLNGHDVVDFDMPSSSVGIDVDPDAGVTPANLSFGQADDFVIAAVVSTSPSMPSAYVWLKAHTICTGTCALMDGLVFAADIATLGADNVQVRESTSDQYLSTNSQPLADHAYHVVAIRRIGDTSLQLRVDTVPKNATITAFDVSQTVYPLVIGASSGNFQGSMAFRMAELIAVHRTSGAINDADVANIEAYLKGRYKTP